MTLRPMRVPSTSIDLPAETNFELQDGAANVKRISALFAMTLSAILIGGCSGSSGPGEDSLPPPQQQPTTVTVSIAGAAVTEGNAGGAELIFPVTLSAAASAEVSVSYATSDGTATAPQDYLAGSGVLRIAAGSTRGEISVSVATETLIEPDETLVVTLSSPSSNATLAAAAATGTIRNDDSSGPAPVVGGQLNDTGLTLCTNASVNGVACNDPASGSDRYPRQDAESGRDFAANDSSDGHAGFSFTKLDASGTPLADQSADYSAAPWACVRDNVTGLIWEVKTDDDGERDRDSTYSWYDSSGIDDGGDAGSANGGVCMGGDCDTQSYAARLNDAMHCGRAGWRLPMRTEALSIVNYGNTVGPFIDAGFIANAAEASYWTAESDSRSATVVDLQRAAVRRAAKNLPMRALFVSGRE
jgi:hypothetical protein